MDFRSIEGRPDVSPTREVRENRAQEDQYHDYQYYEGSAGHLRRDVRQTVSPAVGLERAFPEFDSENSHETGGGAGDAAHQGAARPDAESERGLSGERVEGLTACSGRLGPQDEYVVSPSSTALGKSSRRAFVRHDARR
jgi:hypothetical protein